MEQSSPESPVRLTATVQGYVQGVGFRWSTMSMAQTLKLVGVAENLPNGDVLVIAEGPQRRLPEGPGLAARAPARGSCAAPGRVEFVDARWGPAEGGFRSFTCR